MTIRCPYCSASVIVPPELREPEPAGVTFISTSQIYPSSSSIPPEQMEEIVRLVRAGNKIAAIKAYREATGFGLAESKNFIDTLEKLLSLSGSETPEEILTLFQRSGEALPAVPPASRGATNWVVALIVLVVAAAVLIPIVLAVIIPALTITSAAKQVNVVETVQVDIRTQIGPLRTPTAVPSPSPTPGYASLQLSFGSEGIGPGQFQDARSIAAGMDGRVYVAEYTGGRVQAFDGQGKFLSQFLVDPEMPVQGLGVDREGFLYISQKGVITRYNPDTGEALETFRPPTGSYYGHFTFGPTGQIAAVSSSADSRDDILILDKNGKLLRTIPAAFTSQTNSPELDMTLAVDGLGNLYALGSFNSAVLKFSPDGKFITRFGSRGEEPGQFRSVQGLSVDGQGRVYVSNIGEIQVFDSTGRYLAKIDRQKTVYFGIFTAPDGSLWVAGRTMIYQFRPPAP